MSRPNVARINDWLWVGNCESCQLREAPGTHEWFWCVIHIYRNDKEVEGKPSQERHCVYDRSRANLRMNYRDGDELDPTNLKNLDAFIERITRCEMHMPHPQTTLVHCHAGMCRSPTVAIYLLSMIEGMHPIDAQHLVTKAIYDQRSGEVCNVCYPPLKQILGIWEKRLPWRQK